MRERSSSSAESLRDARLTSKRIDKRLKKDKEERDADPAIKLLCLGSADSGKTTVIKQLHLLQGGGFPEGLNDAWRAIIWHFIVKRAKELALFLQNTTPKQDPKDSFTESIELILSIPEGVEPPSPLDTNGKFDIAQVQPAVIDVAVVEAISVIWQPQKPFENFRLKNHSSAVYFFDNLHRITPDYVPTEADILMVRCPTKQVQTYTFLIEGVAYRVFDVAGSRNQRHVWASYFDDVLSIIFVADISSYSQTLEEDPSVNRLVDSLQLFDSVINNRLLAKTDVILFLNKVDLLPEELKRIPISTFVPAYDGPNELAPVIRMMKSMYNHLNKSNREDRSLYIHTTHATDTKAMKVIWAATTLIIIKLNMKTSGYM